LIFLKFLNCPSLPSPDKASPSSSMSPFFSNGPPSSFECLAPTCLVFEHIHNHRNQNHCFIWALFGPKVILYAFNILNEFCCNSPSLVAWLSLMNKHSSSKCACFVVDLKNGHSYRNIP
jgi:hypothetical protein